MSSALVGQWTRRVLELAVLSDAEATRVALSLVEDRGLVDVLTDAKELVGPDAVRRLLAGLDPARVHAAVTQMSRACEADERLSARARERRERAASPEAVQALEELKRLDVSELMRRAGIGGG